MGFKRIAALAASTLALAGTAAANVVVNGTFDDTSGWQGTFIAQDTGGGVPEITTGTYYYGGSTSTNSIFQVYDLTPDELAQLATGGLEYTMSADLFGFDAQADRVFFEALFVNAGAVIIGSATLSSDTNRPAVWSDTLVAGEAPNFQELIGLLPAGTASVFLRITSERVSGTSNDGYLDNAFFALAAADASAVPLPAAAWLFLAGAGALCAARRRAG